jgi:Ca2+-binding RTX toxin-like protein
VSDLVSNRPDVVSGGLVNTVTANVDVTAFNLVELRVALGSGGISGAPSTSDPQLAALAANGGATPTHALGDTSPAINNGSTDLSTDQRGVSRPQGAADDVGSFEFEQDAELLCAGQTVTIVAPSEGGVTVGTQGRDIIAGSSVPDEIKGRGGKDVVCGGSGGDRILGGEDSDVLRGDGGRDLLRGQGSKDTLRGGAGRDKCQEDDNDPEKVC